MNYRNKDLLRAVSQLPCQICGIEGQTQASHSNQLEDGKGMGIKASDAMIASICYNCHAEIDQGKKYDKETRKAVWDKAHRRTMRILIEQEYLIVNKSKL
jgi:hypothetical protein